MGEYTDGDAGMIRGGSPMYSADEHLLMTIAGPVIDHLFSRQYFGFERDIHDEVWSSEDHEEDWDEQCNCDTCGIRVIVTTTPYMRLQSDEWISRAYNMAYELIDRHWHVLEAMATDLLVRRRLTPEQVAAHCQTVADDEKMYWIELDEKYRVVFKEEMTA